MTYTMTVDGGAQPTGDTFGVVNPATGEVFDQAPECSREQLDAAFDSAQKAYREWRSDEAARREALGNAANLLFGSANDIAPILTAEQGKPLAEATTEVFGAGVWFKYFAELDLPTEVIQDDDNAHAEVVRKPL